MAADFRWRRDLELDWTLGLLLKHYRPRGNSVAVAHVSDPQLDQLAGP
jgi:hypothetical protein